MTRFCRTLTNGALASQEDGRGEAGTGAGTAT
jgi:hypothetical protein